MILQKVSAMKKLIEWCFDFCLMKDAQVSIERKIAENVAFTIPTNWAEKRDYGIGGGLSDKDGVWHIRFGLCATKDDQLIPESDAKLLLEEIVKYCKSIGCSIKGGYREFTEEELKPLPYRDE